MRLAVLTLLCLCVAPLFALAQVSDAPLDISADDALEWDRNKKTFVARGNARAQQGDVSIDAQTLTAFYRDGADSNFDLYQMLAEDNVVLKSADNTAYGQRAVYKIDDAYAVLTGDDLRIETAEQIVTANDKFEYFVQRGEFKATGRAQIKRPQDTLTADAITANMYTNKKGERVLRKVIADGDVIIETTLERVTGKRGIYDARRNKVEITGGVTITRGPNILQGARAEVDLNTHVSRLFGDASEQATGGRVKGTFYPDAIKADNP